MSTSCVGTVLDAIRAALILRANLSGVNVFSGPVSADEGGTECVWFGDARFNEEESAMGGERAEVWNVDGQVWAIVKPWQGTTETTIKAARDRALALYAEIETHINDTYVSSYPHATLTAGELKQGVLPDGRGASVDFTLTIANIKDP